MAFLKGLGLGSLALIIGLLAFSITFILPLLSIVAVVVLIFGGAGVIGQQYYAYSKEKESEKQ